MTVQFDETIVSALATRLSQWKSEEELTKLYQWPIESQIDKLRPEFESLAELINQKINKNTFEKTLCLRREIKKLKFSFPLSKWIIECWGGITTGKDAESLRTCLDEADKNNFDFNRIASWSKHVAFKYPEQYAIYDARVIYSLNWLLFKAGSKQYFPAPSGRNSVMELLDYRILLFIGHYKFDGVRDRLNEDINERKTSPGRKSYVANKLNKELFFDRKEAFVNYCQLLKIISQKLYQDGKTDLALTRVEMMLFSLADKDIALEVLGDFSKILSPSENAVPQHS